MVAQFARKRSAIEREEAAGDDREDPLDGGVLEDIVGEAGDDEGESEKADERGEVFQAVAGRQAADLPDWKVENEEVQSENNEADYTAVDIELHEIIVGFIGAEAFSA